METNNTPAAGPLPMHLLEAFEQIVNLAERSDLGEEFFCRAAFYIEYAARRLEMSDIQVVLLALFVDSSHKNKQHLSEISRYTGCRITKIIRLSKELDELVRRGYLRVAGSDLQYTIPIEVLTALRDNEPYVEQEVAIENTRDFFEQFDKLIDERNERGMKHCDIVKWIEQSLGQIKDSHFARELHKHELGEENTALFVYMAHLFVENRDDNIRLRDIEPLFNNEEVPYWCKSELRNRSSELFHKKLIENANEDGMARADAFKLTNYAKMDVLRELDLLVGTALSDKCLIKADSFAAKNLVYSADEKKQVDELASILSAERFAEVQARLRGAGMRTGFCCLFYGPPGTGKTETVYQMARLTGRDIMRVDVDKIKSCWVGESEKNIKELFDRYRNICENAKLAPILLFNEADAVLGVRMNGASKAVDKMENSIQNIILQEMETLEGIMIATTNLTGNLDKAFERRFLYKVNLRRPDAAARAAIWLSMMPALNAADARKLANRFDLSGGEIENVVRKYSVNAILSGRDTCDAEVLADICSHERIAARGGERVGF